MKPLKREVIILFDYFNLHDVEKTPTMCDIENHLAGGNRKRVSPNKLQIIIRELKETECYRDNEGVDRFLMKMKKYLSVGRKKLREPSKNDEIDEVVNYPIPPQDESSETARPDEDESSEVFQPEDDESDVDSIFDDFVLQAEFDDFRSEITHLFNKEIASFTKDISNITTILKDLNERIEEHSEAVKLMHKQLQQMDKVVENLTMVSVPEPQKGPQTPSNANLRKLFNLMV